MYLSIVFDVDLLHSFDPLALDQENLGFGLFLQKELGTTLKMDVLRFTDDPFLTINMDRVEMVVLAVFNYSIRTYSYGVMAHQYRVFGVDWLFT